MTERGVAGLGDHDCVSSSFLSILAILKKKNERTDLSHL